MITQNRSQDHNTQDIGSLLLQGIIQYRTEITRYQKGRECERPEFSRFKLKIWWRDGNENVFYSYDYDYCYPNGIRTRHDDEHRGLWKLLKYVGKQKEANTIGTAVIWMATDHRPATVSSDYSFCVAKSIKQQKGILLPEFKTAEGKWAGFINGKVNMNLLRESLDKKFMMNFSEGEYNLIKLNKKAAA